MAESVRRLRGAWRLVICGLLALALSLPVLMPRPAAAQAGEAGLQSYALQPGDRLQLTMLELPVAPMVSQIGIGGRVTFPYLGGFDAAGLTLEELQQRISLAATGKLVAVYTPVGERLQLALDGSGVFLSVDSYRPVYMTGDVATRGAVDYMPGMTVRTALASAGGASEVPVLFEQALMQAPGMKSQYRTLATQHASALVELWGIDAQLAGDPDRPAPAAAQVSVGPDELAAFIEAERANVRFGLEDFDRRKAALARQLGALSGRIDRFGGQLSNQEAMLDLENAQLQQVEQLVERGLSVAARLNEARQSVLNVSSSVLNAQSAMADMTLSQQQLEQELDMLDFTREGELRADRAELAPQVLSLAAQVQAARQSMEMNGVIVEENGPQQPSVAFEITRAGRSGTATSPATLDTTLLPGDVVDVQLSYPFSMYSTAPAP